MPAEPAVQHTLSSLLHRIGRKHLLNKLMQCRYTARDRKALVNLYAYQVLASLSYLQVPHSERPQMGGGIFPGRSCVAGVFILPVNKCVVPV